jgi:hypothetical protein
MEIHKAKVTAKTAAKPEPVTLTLVSDARGWTYSVDGVTGGDFLLPWRAVSAEEASETLLQRFPESAFAVEVVERK